MHKKGCHRSTHQRKRREMKLVLLFLLPARSGLKAKCAEGGGEGENGEGLGGGRRGWDSLGRKGSRGQKPGV